MNEPIKSETCTQVIPVIDVGMYDSVLSPYDMFRDYDDNGDEIERSDEEWDRFDSAKYKEIVGKAAAEIVNPLFNGFEDKYGISVKSDGGITSPRYYNFETDELNLTVETADGFMEKALAAIDRFRQNERIVQYVNDNWKTRDGFWSFMPESINELENGIKTIEERPYWDRSLAGYACLCAIEADLIPNEDDEGYDYLESSDFALYEEISGNHYFEEFLTEAA